MSTVIEPRTLNAPHASRVGAKKKADKEREQFTINALIELNERHAKYSGARDRWALIELSYEYINIGCPRIAKGIVKEAEGL